MKMKITLDKFLDKRLGLKQVKIDNEEIFNALKKEGKLGQLTYKDIEIYNQIGEGVYYVNSDLTRIGKGAYEVVELALDCETMEEVLLREIFYQEDKVEFSFRFNEERKSVTLYKDGQKVQFVKCHQDDKFSWKIGLGVAFYKYLGKEYQNDPEVQYIKGILNWKMFYTYVLASMLNFDKDKLDRLEARVKRAKLYKEIKIND